MKKRFYNDVLDAFIEIEYPPRKIVSLDPASTETIFMLGGGDSIIATDAFSYRPEEARKKKKIGSYTHVVKKELRELSPDLLVTTLGAQKPLTRELVNEGYPVYPMRVATSVSVILNNVLLIGNLIGRQEEARELYSSLLRRLNFEAPAERPVVYVEFDLGGPISPGYPTHVSDALWLVGAKNALDFMADAYVSPDPSVLRGIRPDLIIYEPKRNSAEELERFKRSLIDRGLEQLLDTPIILTRGDFIAHQGPSFVTEAIPWLRGVISSLRKF
jgi:iron complex transport system substrate-binding protein